MGYPTFQAQVDLQKRDREEFEHLKRTDPKAARELAIKRLKRIGALDDDGHFTEEFVLAWTRHAE